MIDWAARARLHLDPTQPPRTVKTDETRLASVSSVPSAVTAHKREGVSSVLAVVSDVVVAVPNGPAAANSGSAVRSLGNSYLTPSQTNECHASAWDDREIATYLERAKRFAARGRADAEDLAERLVLRDREADDRNVCLECSELANSGRCAAALRGAIPAADRRLEPVQNILMRCESFKAAP